MRVTDDILINDFQKLYNRKIVIYGAGEYGKKTLEILRHLPEAHIDSFCVSKNNGATKSEYEQIEDIPVKSLEVVCEETHPSDTFFIVSGNPDNTDQMIEQLGKYYTDNEIAVVTYIGFYLGAYFNIGKGLFSKEFEEWLQIKNELGTAMMRVSLQYESAMRIFDKDNIWVYQPAKVGSTSIWAGLEASGIPCIHIHRIHTYNMEDYYYVPHVRNYFKLFEQDENAHRGIKIISLVREPIARSISQIFQWIAPDFIIECAGWKSARGSNLAEMCINQIKKDMKTGRLGYVFNWFDAEIKSVFGIDVYQHDFDKEAGFGIIREKGVEILLLKMETLKSNEGIIANFCGSADFQIRYDNAASGKNYHYLYDDLKQKLIVPNEVLDFYYSGNVGMDHFYTKKEIEKFRAHYMNKCNS